MTRHHSFATSLLALFAAIAPAALGAAQQEPPQQAADEEAKPCDPKDPDDERPECRPRIIGAGGGGSGAGTVTFDWDGPDRIDFGIYDAGCLHYGLEFQELVNANSSLVGSVAQQVMTWDAVLASARAKLREPNAKAAYDAVKELGGKAAFSAYQPAAAASVLADEQSAVLASLLAGVERAPDDPNALFNFASALARDGLANEAATVIGRLQSSGRPVSMPLAIDAQASLDYLAGYTEMLRGNLGQAKARFAATISREPFLYEAAHSLALVQAHEGNGATAKLTYRSGMWRFKPKYLVACGARGEDKARPPVDDMFDTSHGVEGKLSEFWHPDKAGDLGPFFEMMGALATASNAEAAPLQQRMIALSMDPRFAGGTDDPYDTFAGKISELISSLEDTEPYVLQAKDRLEAAMAQATKVSATNQAFVLRRLTELAVRPGNHCPTYRSLISQGVEGVRPHAERVEEAFREYARDWYKMATGLNWHIGDPAWFESNDLGLRAQLAAMNAGMLMNIVAYYGFPADVVRQCPEEFVPYGEPVAVAPEQGLSCKDVLGNQTFKMDFAPPAGAPGPKFNVEAGCDKIRINGNWDAVNVKAPGFGLKMGGRFSGTFERHKGFSMMGGVGADVSALGQKGSITAGGYVEGDAVGLTGLGGRYVRNPPNQPAEKMDFPLIPKPASALRGPRLKPHWQAN